MTLLLALEASPFALELSFNFWVHFSFGPFHGGRVHFHGIWISLFLVSLLRSLSLFSWLDEGVVPVLSDCQRTVLSEGVSDLLSDFLVSGQRLSCQGLPSFQVVFVRPI